MKKRIAFITMLLTMAGSHVVFADSGTVTASSLRIRQKSSISSSIISSLARNTRVETLGKEGDFYKINYKGQTGYVYSSYIKVSANTSGSTSKTNGAATSGLITAGYLNVRSGSGINYPVANVITRGTKVTMYEKSNGFYKINYGGKTGYVSEQYVKATTAQDKNTNTNTNTSTGTDSTSSVTTGIGNITASSLNVRKTASMGNNIMGVIKINAKVNLYGTQNGFYKIKYNGQWGYIAKTYVSQGNSAPSRGGTTENESKYDSDGQQGTATKNIDSLISQLNTFLGMPYLWGGTTPAKFNSNGKYVSGGFDCSGLIQYAYKNIGINLPRTTMDQINRGSSVNINNLQKGDLVFFRTNPASPSQASHAGIYIGNNKFIQSPKTGDVVKISQLTGYYKSNFITGKRVVK